MACWWMIRNIYRGGCVAYLMLLLQYFCLSSQFTHAVRSVATLQEEHPCILQHFNAFLERVNGKRVAVFLDYDGGCRQDNSFTALEW